MLNNLSQARGFAGDADARFPAPPPPLGLGFFTGLVVGVVVALCFNGDCDAFLDVGAEYIGRLFSSCAVGRIGKCE